ncbi:hypothetical protein OsI_08072 [Oryza sativa Indica Group]|uniref:DUF6598 domain-containing protein n=1 Tax=Oryza sativa subsp. indica TaxID=39946 RepID=B8AFG0_ORYSI|nr:hypothetical protein OsI_08072 [Oryza sativa Indica Group]
MHVALNPPDGVAPVDVIRSTLSGSTRAEPDRVPRAYRLGVARLEAWSRAGVPSRSNRYCGHSATIRGRLHGITTRIYQICFHKNWGHEFVQSPDIDSETPRKGVEFDMDLASLRDKVDREVLNTWLWDNELDLLLRESEEQDEELNLQDSDSDELSDICGASDLYEYDSDVEYADADEGHSFFGYGHEFYYEDGNPYYAADREEKWENEILGKMEFPVPKANATCDFSFVWEGSLQVEGQFQVDPNRVSVEHLFPQLPKWESRWVNGDGKEPCCRAIQVFSLDLSSPSNDSMEIYGTFAFRDVRNSQLRNCIFEYSRENPCKLNPGAHKLQPLITPSRGIYAVGLVLIEYFLIIKGQTEEEDEILIDGYSIYAPSFYGEFERLHWHIDTGHFSTLDLRMVSIPRAVLVRLEFEVYHIEENHQYNSLTIAATYNMFQGSFITFNGKLSVGKLPPFTLPVNHDGYMHIYVYAYQDQLDDARHTPDGVISDYFPGCVRFDLEEFLCESTSLTPQKDGTSTQMADNLDGIEMAIKATWSTLLDSC